MAAAAVWAPVMRIAFVPLALAILAAILVVVVVLISRRVGGSSPTSSESGQFSLRRFLQYALLLAALFTTASGATRLLATALPVDGMAGRRTAELALGLSLTLVGAPVWALLWRFSARRLSQEPEERDAVGWSLCLVVVTAVSLIVAFTNLVEVGQWVVGTGEHRPDAVASAAVWTAVWGAHTWLLGHRRLGPTNAWRELAVLVGCVVGLVALASGAAGVLRSGFGELYGLLTGPVLAEAASTQALRDSVVVAVLAVPVWWWHWLRQAATAPGSALWHTYVVLVAVLGGLLTAVLSLGVMLHAVLQWLFGVPEAATAGAHFEALPGTLAAAVVGAWVWRYHDAVLDRARGRVRAEPERIYEHLVAAVGLVAAGAGIVRAVMAALQAVTPGALATADPAGRNALVAAITLLLVGTPLWWAFWHRLQSQIATSDGAERRSPSRRAYLFLLFGVTGLTAMISLAVILFVLFRDLLEGTLAVTVVADLRAAIGLVLTAGGVSAYHWAVYRDDRAATSQPAPARPRSVLLVSADGRQLADSVAAGTGASVRPLHRLDTPAPREAPAPPVNPDEVTAAILASPHERVLVTIEEDGSVRVIPYDLQ